MECPVCGSDNIIEDTETAELICQDCGTVIEEGRVKGSAEIRAFTSERIEEVRKE